MQEQKRIVVSVNNKEFEALKAIKEKEGKTMQFIIYKALEDAGYFNEIKRQKKKHR